MKLIRIPEPVALTTLAGQAVTSPGPDGSQQQIQITLKDYLLGALTDPAVTSDLKGLPASLRLLEIHQAITAHQDWTPGAALHLEDDHCRRLAAVINDPSAEPDPRWRHCLVPLGLAVVSAT